MNFEVILWTSITVAVLVGVFGMIFYIISAKNIRNRRKSFSELHENLKTGKKIIFAGGIFGKVVKVDGDLVDVEISKGVVVTISRYIIQNEIND